MDLDNLDATNHNGGAISLRRRRQALRRGRRQRRSAANAQSLSTRLGKMLRINPDGSIPSDNPTAFAGVPGAPVGVNRAIWAVGLRNPFTFALNNGGPAPTMLINDVGEGTWEEINDGLPGANYGWPDFEGVAPNPGATTNPRHAYNHSGGACAITGGAFYAPPTLVFPGEYLNDYFFADNCAGFIRRLDLSTGNVTGFATGVSGPVDLKVGTDGFLYYLAGGAGAVYRVAYGNVPPGITAHPANQVVSPGQAATFRVSVSGTPPTPSSGSASRARTGPTSATTAPATRSAVRCSPTTAPASGSTSPTPSATSSATRRP